MHDKIKIAVIGAGYWGTKLIGEYLELARKRNDVQLLAVGDESDKRLQHLSQSMSLSKSLLVQDYHQILENQEITAVHIATPNETHYEIATEAINEKKHVLLEKPMCLSSSDAFRLARLSEKNNIVLLIGHIFRFNNAINKVKELVEKQQTSVTRYIELRWASHIPPPPGRDIIFDLAPHPVDILNHIYEEWPTHVYAKAHSYERKTLGLEEVALAALDFPKDIIASITLSWLHHGPRQRTVTIVNEEETIVIEAVDQRITIYDKSQVREIPIQSNNTIESEITHFVECIKNNDPPINSALTGAVNVTVLERMRNSVQENRVNTVTG